MQKNRIVVRDLQQVMEEIRATEGLSTEAQLWDEIMKKEAFLMPEGLFPLIKEVHGKEYPRTATIRPLATEYSIERADTKEIASIRADITVLVEERDIYHFECEMDKDGTMVLRMFEYDVHMALTYSQESEDGQRVVRFPYSAVLYLQNNRTVPDSLSCTVEYQDGSRHEYRVPVLKVQTYSLEEIHRKHLCVLIPFLPLRFRTRLPLSDKKPNKKIAPGELTDFYQQIILILEQEVKDGYLTENNRKMILSLLDKSMIRVFYKEKSLQEEVLALTKPILELEFEKVERLEKELAAAKAENERRIAEKEKEVAEKEKEVAEKDKQLAAERAENERLRAELAKYQK